MFRCTLDGFCKECFFCFLFFFFLVLLSFFFYLIISCHFLLDRLGWLVKKEDGFRVDPFCFFFNVFVVWYIVLSSLCIPTCLHLLSFSHKMFVLLLQTINAVQ